MYLSHFDLKFMPFGLTPDMAFDAMLSKQQEALKVLLLGLKQGEGFMKITGEVGTGKTFLCRKLIKTVKKHYETVLIFEPNLNRIGLLKEIADSVGVQYDGLTDGRDLLRRIQQRFLAIHQSRKRVLIIVDEAQHMPASTLEALRLLTNFESGRKKLVQVVLFGQSELDEKLKLTFLRPLKQRIVFSYELKPMMQSEVQDYLSHRLGIAGGKMFFTLKTLPMIYRLSGGIPRIVNILAHKALMSAYGRGKNEVNKYDVRIAAKDTDDILFLFKQNSLKRAMSFIAMSAGLLIAAIVTIQFLRAFV